MIRHLLIPYNSALYILLPDHCLDSLADGHLVVENHQLLVVWQEVPDGIFFIELADVRLHAVNSFLLLFKTSLFL